MPGPLKPPRRDCRQASRWLEYYRAVAAWYQSSADIIRITSPHSTSVKLAERDAERFREGARKIENATHPKVVSGEWR